ncbi:hypothetical protein [Klebsiella pneumoniae IS22]|nr:hypothetical protein [Klebsiella pneumoniae IS22]
MLAISATTQDNVPFVSKTQGVAQQVGYNLTNTSWIAH